MRKPHPYQPQRHPSGRGYGVFDHRDKSGRGHWSNEETAAIFATTWNLQELSQERDDLLAALIELRNAAAIGMPVDYTWLAAAHAKASAAIAKAEGT